MFSYLPSLQRFLYI